MNVIFVNKTEDYKQRNTSKWIIDVNNIPYIHVPFFFGAVIFIGAVLISWLFGKDCASITSVELSSPFLYRTGRSCVKIS